MTRSSVGLAFGLLLVPSLAHAQPSGSTPAEGRIIRPFQNVFNGRMAPLSQLSQHTQKRPAMQRTLEVPPDCRMPIMPIDPALDARIRVGKVDERLDPRFVVKVPACEPSNTAQPPRD